MKFAHIRASEYFTFAKQIFHSKAISLARRANFVEKSTCLRKCFFLVGDGGFVTTTSRSALVRSNCKGTCFTSFSNAYRLQFSWRSLRHHLPPTQKACHSACLLCWWEMVDSDHRSETQQIYSLPPLATRELPHLELHVGVEPTTC